MTVNVVLQLDGHQDQYGPDQQAKFDIVIFPCGIVRALAKTAQEYYASRHSHGSNKPFANRVHDFDGLPFSVVTDFDYPGHSKRRMHGLPTRAGAELIDALRARVEALDIPLICARRAVTWGRALCARTRHLGAYQGHGNVAHPHGILITRAVITQGGFQVNSEGSRYWNEAQGYSEAARAVLAQPNGTAWTVYDARIADMARQFQDFKEAGAQGAIVTADSIEGLADRCDLPSDALCQSFTARPTAGPDAFGRVWDALAALAPPYCAVKVTGALFHTQGGLEVDPETALVRRDDGAGIFANLYAAGGAACGVSGSGDSGSLSGSGLLAVAVLGYIAGRG